MRMVVQGLVASTTEELEQGGVSGVARVLSRFEIDTTASQLQPGEIFVTQMTDSAQEPNLMYACAIITDLGGFTCHASMAANRFGIPCVVGTRDATKLIKTGDHLLITKDGDVYVTN